MTARGLHGRDLVLVLLVCLFWATNFLTSAHALREVPPFLFTAMRMGLLAALLVGFLRVPPRSQWNASWKIFSPRQNMKSSIFVSPACSIRSGL